jgi:amino acid adenylation domain-containing protein
MNRASATPPDGVAELLHQLALDGWRFWLEEGRLRYRAPKAAATAGVLEELKTHRAALVELLTAAPHSLDICPLSYGQTALWFLWRLAPESHAYNQSLPLRIADAADDAMPRWRAACAALAARHPMLRTIFPARGGQPYQQVLPEAAPVWQTSDASAWDAAHLAAALDAAHAAPFDLAQPPALRCHWFADAAGRGQHILLLTLHHIRCDGWSLELMRRELTALAAPAADPLPPVPAFTYHDYVRWQRALLDGAEGERLWEFWRGQLAGPLPLLDLPGDQPRPLIQRYDGASCALDLSPALSQALQQLAQAEGATRFELLLAAFFTLLHRCTGQEDLLVGAPHAGRSRPEFAPLVGYFVNPLVLRAAVDPGMSFRRLLGDVRERARAAIDHAEFPFPLLVQRLQPERSPDRSPIFDVSMNYHTLRSLAEPGGAEMIEIPQADGKFDLTLNIVEEGDRLHGALGYNRTIFDAATVRGWADAFTALLHGIVAQPDAPLATLPLQTARDLTPALAGPRRPIAPEQMLHLRFAAQAAQHPHAPAVADEHATLTYGELDRRASALAAVLRERGAGPDARVAICTGRSVDFCVAMLATLQAGAAYVPLDPASPADLLAFMVAHAGAVALLTQAALLPDLPPLPCPVLCIDADHPPPAPTEPTPVTLDNLAYVMYTSGSTGRPKAVAVTHGAVANYTESMVRDLAIDAPYNFLLASTFAADLGNTAIFPALGSGGCLHILPEAARLDPKAFAALMADREIDYLKIVPSHLAALLGDDPARALPRRALVLGGEGAAPAWVARLQDAAPACRIYNHYGPTESTVGVLTHRWDPAAPPPTATLPLSRAVANTEIFLLDAAMQPTPPGAVGELYVGGVCLARGYLGDDGAQGGFVHLATESGAARRLYRTGDLARQRTNGALEVLGRKDRQVKLRGYRIELAQIEQVLRQAPGVAQAAVITDHDGAAATALLAFVVGHGAAAQSAELHRHLAAHLPRYMLPASVTPVERISVTANGKLDTAALRQLASAEGAASAPAAGSLPRDLVELELTRLWGDLLARPQVDIHDNFFEVGGHSLLAVQLAAQIETTFGVWIPLATLLTHPTIAGLAQVIRRTERGPVSLLAPLSQSGSGAPILMLPGAGGSVIYLADLAQRLAAHSGRPVWGLQAIGLDPGQAIPQAVEAIAAHYVTLLRQAFPTATAYTLVGHSFGALVGYELARQLQGVQPTTLCVLDNPAPQAGALPDYAGYDHGDWLVHIATRIGKLNRVALHLTRDELDGLDDAAQNALLVARLVSQGLLPAEVTPAYFSRFIDVYRANARAAVEYRPAGAAPIDLLVVRAAAADAALGVEDAARRQVDDPAWGWQTFTTHPVETAYAPGTHLSIFAPPAVATVAAVVGAWLEKHREEET